MNRISELSTRMEEARAENESKFSSINGELTRLNVEIEKESKQLEQVFE